MGAPSRTAIFTVAIEPNGEIVGIKLVVSTGMPQLDQTALQMIYRSAPFLPLPFDYPQTRTNITVFIPIFPRGGGAGFQQ